MIIDAHMHLPVNYCGLAAKKEALLREMERNGVGGAVVISDSAQTSDIGSMRDCMELFRGVPNVGAVGGISPFIAFREQLELLEYGISQGLLVGIKIYCGHEPVFLDGTELAPVFALAESCGVPVLFHSGWENPQYSSADVIARTAEARRGVTLICCHCCFPDIEDCFDKLAGYRNVNFDISSLADSPWHTAVITKSLEKAVRAMPERFIFGSDSFCCDQAEHIRFAERLDISPREKRLLFCENAARLYGFHSSL